MDNNHCAPGLIELRNALKREIEEESLASSKYREASVKLLHYKLPTLAENLRSIANQEFMHHFIVMGIVDAITEHCGE